MFTLQNAANVIISCSRKCNNVTVISSIITIWQYYDLITHTDTDWPGLSWTAMQNSETVSVQYLRTPGCCQA